LSNGNIGSNSSIIGGGAISIATANTVIETASRHVCEMLDKFLDIAKLQDGSLRLSEEQFCLTHLCGELMNMCMHMVNCCFLVCSWLRPSCVPLFLCHSCPLHLLHDLFCLPSCLHVLACLRSHQA
jgi:hypothetical protein